MFQLFSLNAYNRYRHQFNLEMMRDITGDVEESEFVPYACFYNHHTIITKNGELCQTIRVTGLKRELFGEQSAEQELRSLIRETLKRHVPNDSFAIWLHTIRKNRNVAPGGEFPEEGFAREMHDAWVERNEFAHQYANEVYITIVHEGEDARIRTPQAFMQGLVPGLDTKRRNVFIDRIYEVLNGVVERIVADLEPFGAARLSTYKHDGIYYSEQLRFLEKIINFVDRPMPVVEMDLCQYLTTGEITFAFNAMEVRTAMGKRRFASILTLKEYKEASLPVIDQFLQLPMEFIVTQCVNFVNPQKVLFEYQEMYNYQRLSDDNNISKLSELSEVIHSNRGNPNDFGEQQLTIFILADTIKTLEENVRRSIKYFAKYGMVALREDIKFEETYWAQLPGNFVFVSRMQPTSTSHVAGFANLNNMPTGQESGNRWGAALTTFHTSSGTPYYFNFHYGECGHCLMVGGKDTGKKVLMHFLLAQAMKYAPALYYFDLSGKGREICRRIGAKVIEIDAEPSPVQIALFNPFSLPDNPSNQQFLARWVGVLLRTGDYIPNESDKQAIAQAIAMTYKQPASQRHLSGFAALATHAAPAIAAPLTHWLPGGRYGYLFTATDAGALGSSTRFSFQMADVLEDAALHATVFSLLAQIVTHRLDGSPAIIVMEEGWKLLMQSHLGGNISGWLEHLTERNALLLSSIEDIETAVQMQVSADLARHSPTRIYMPNDEADESYVTVLGLNESELAYLELMEVEDRHFLVKHGGETVIGEMNMLGLDEYLNILKGLPPQEAMEDDEHDSDDESEDESEQRWGGF